MSVSTQTARILAVLADAKPHTTAEIHRRAGFSRLNSRIADLRKQGKDIVCEHMPKKGKGPAAYRYTWVNAPPLAEPPPVRPPTDTLAPRTLEKRYRIFRVKDGGEPEFLETAPTEEQVGVTLCRLGREKKLLDYCVGIQDTFGDPTRTGEWIVLPWQAQPS